MPTSSDHPVTISFSRGLDAAAVMYGDDKTLWVERCTRLDLSVKKKKVTTKIPFPTLHCLLLIRLRGQDVFLNCLLCLNSPPPMVQVLFVCWDQTVVNKLYEQAPIMSAFVLGG